jgi:hypothetical protein
LPSGGTGNEGRHTAPAGLPDQARVIQRDVGFEFEVDEVDTYKKGFFGGVNNLKKKDEILVRQGLFKVEADEREDHTTDMEIVTEAFPETMAGGIRLAEAMREITALCDQLKLLNRPGNRTISAAQLAAYGMPVGNRWLRPKGGADIDFLFLTAKPQVTAGIRMNRLHRLFQDIERAALAGMGAPANPGARLAIGGANPLNPASAGSPSIAAARAGANAAIGAVAADFGRVEPHAAAFGSEALRGLVTLLATYLVEGRRGVSGYAKTIANPLMARTDFATLYAQLPLPERRYFRRTRDNNTWLNLVLDAAARAAGVPNLNADAAVFEGRLFNDVMMYGVALGRPVADPRFQTNVLPELTKRAWLNGIAFEYRDKLTQAHYPGTAAKKAELESLGGYGNKMDVAAGGAAREAPIFEFRGLDSKRYAEWYSFAMSTFRYIRAVNLGLAEDYLETVTPARLADLLGAGGAPARLAEQRNQATLAMTPILAW